MPKDDTKDQTTEATVAAKSAKTEVSAPKSKILAPNSPWKILHSDESIGTYVMEIVGIGVLVRTESPKENSESMVFIPNIKLSDLPSSK